MTTFLNDILASLVGKSDHHLNNSKHLAKEMISVMVEEYEIYISHDGVSLFTNTPIHLALQVIRERLEGYTELHTRTCLTVRHYGLIEVPSDNQRTSLSGASYTNRCSVLPMGSPVSPLLANLFGWRSRLLPRHRLNANQNFGSGVWTMFWN